MQISSTIKKNDVKIFVILTIMLFTVYLFTADGHRHSSDESIAHDQSKRLLLQKPHPDYIQDESHYGFDYRSLKNPRIQPICYNGILCSTIPIGYSLTQVPFILLNNQLEIVNSNTLKLTTDDFQDAHYVFWRNTLDKDFVFLELTYGPFFSALSVGVFFLLCRTFDFSTKNSIFVSLLFGLSTIVWAYSQTSLNIVPAMFFNLLGFFFFRSYLKNPQYRPIIFCGVSFGFAYLIRSDAIIFIVVLIPFLIYNLKNSHEKLKISFSFIIPIFSSFLIQKIIDFVRFGTSYVSKTTSITEKSSEIPSLFGHDYPLYLGGLGLLLSPGIGLFIFSPIIFTIFFSYADFFKKHKQECIFSLLLVCSFVIFLGTVDRWHGLIGWGARYLFVLLPVLLLPLVASLDIRNKKSLKIILLILGIIGILFNFLTLSQDVTWYVWGQPGINGLYLVDKIDGIRNDLNLDPSVMWSIKYSQITQSAKMLIFNPQLDLYLLKVLGIGYFSLALLCSLIPQIYIMFKMIRKLEPNSNKQTFIQ